MYPPIYPTVAASSACRALLKSGNGPLRFYQFGFAGDAPQRPYAVWQRVAGSPENYLSDRPDMDAMTLMVDVYAGSGDSARSVATALRDAVEGACYITLWLEETTDPDTKSIRASFQSDWLVPR